MKLLIWLGCLLGAGAVSTLLTLWITDNILILALVCAAWLVLAVLACKALDMRRKAHAPADEDEEAAAEEEAWDLPDGAPCPKCDVLQYKIARFCRQCGAILIQASDESAVPEDESQNMTSTLDEDETIGEKVPDKTRLAATALKDAIASQPPLIRRSFMLLEDRDWEKAQEYLERALDENPENAYAYLGKIMADLSLPTFDSLAGAHISDNRNFEKCIRFADEILLTALMNLLKGGEAV